MATNNPILYALTFLSRYHIASRRFGNLADLASARHEPLNAWSSKARSPSIKWELKQLNPDLPSDWTGYDYLVLEMKASSPQRFNLTLHSVELIQRRQMQPLANVWIRAAVPLQYYRQPNRSGFDLASVGKVPRNSFWISTGGAYGPLNAVTALSVSMQAPLGQPTLEIRSVKLAKEDPGSDILD